MSDKKGEIIDRILAGQSKREIGEAVGLNPRSIEHYMKQLYVAYGVSGWTRTKRKRLQGLVRAEAAK